MGLLDIEKNINNEIPYELFDQYQINEIQNGLLKGLDVSKYCNPDYTWYQMHQIRYFLEKGIDISIYVGPQLNHICMHRVGLCLEKRGNPEPLLNPLLEDRQVEQIYYGIVNGLDVSEYCDPNNSAEYMFNKRLQMMRNKNKIRKQ